MSNLKKQSIQIIYFDCLLSLLVFCLINYICEYLFSFEKKFWVILKALIILNER